MHVLGVLAQIPTDPKKDTVLNLILSSHPVLQAALGILALFSIITWTIIFFKYLQFAKAKRSSIRLMNIFEKSQTIDEVLTKVSPQKENPAYEIFTVGISDILHHKRSAAKDPAYTSKLNFAHIQRNVDRAMRDETTKLEEMIPFLATTASTTPFIGLFGTVIGILIAFNKFKSEDVASAPLQILGPHVAEALIATAAGLAAAIPAVMAYNYFVNKLKKITKLLEEFADELLHRIEKEYF